MVADPHRNFAKCAEAGTCRQIEEKHGSDVDTTGDKISAFGLHGLPGGGKEISHVAACTSGNHKQFNCNGVGEIKRLDDVNRPGRPDSSLSNSPKPLAPIKTSKSPTPDAGSSSRPHSPGTPPQRSPPASKSPGTLLRGHRLHHNHQYQGSHIICSQRWPAAASKRFHAAKVKAVPRNEP